MFVLDDFFLAADRTLIFAYDGVRVVRRCERATIDKYCDQDSDLLDGHRLLLNSNNAKWSICTWHGHFLYVGCPSSLFIVLTATGFLTTYSSSFVLKTGFFVYVLLVSVLVLLSVAISCLSAFSLIRVNFAKRRLGNMRRNMLPEKSEVIADGKVNDFAPSGCLDSTGLNQGTSVDRWAALLIFGRQKIDEHILFILSFRDEVQ